MVNQIIETGKRLNSGKIEKTNVIFLNNIVMKEGKVHLEFGYNQIKKIVEIKNFIVLMITDESRVLVFKDGFLKGNKDDFLLFINSKIISK